MKKCNDVMTKDPACCLPGDTVKKVAEMMKSGRVGAIPVIENEQTRKLIGIITDRDLTLKIVAEGLDSNSAKVDSVMTRKVITCHAEESLQKVLDAMSENQLRRIPVVDEDYKILGIIAQADIAIRADQPEKAATMVKEISRSSKK